MKEYEDYRDSVNIFDTQKYRQESTDSIKKVQELVKEVNEKIINNKTFMQKINKNQTQLIDKLKYVLKFYDRDWSDL